MIEDAKMVKKDDKKNPKFEKKGTECVLQISYIRYMKNFIELG